MICINCSTKTSTSNSRPSKKYAAVWRRHACGQCGTVFSTNEEPTYQEMVVEDAHSSQPFSMPRLMYSITPHLSDKNPDDGWSLAVTIRDHLWQQYKNSAITKQQVTETAYRILDRYDQLGASTYARAHGIAPARTQKRKPGRPRAS